MSKYGVIWKYQLKLLFRNKLLMIGLLFLFAAGLYGARYGNSFVSRQLAIIHTVDTAHQRDMSRVTEMLERPAATNSTRKTFYPPYAGSQMFYYTPSGFASLAIGQKDNLPFYHEAGDHFSNIFTVNSTAIQNPVKLLTGNFDLSFVLLYLFPLYIIVLGYNIISEEQEQGTYTLLRAQGNERVFVLQKLLFRFVLMSVVSVLMNITCFAMNGISVSDNLPGMAAWLFITVAYVFFWFAVVYLVITLRRSGAVSALALGGSWVILLLLIPSMVHNAVTDSHEKELVQTIFNSRGDYPKAWQMDPSMLKDSFSRLNHPYPLPPMEDTSAEAKMAYRNIMASEIQRRFDNSLGRLAIESQAKEYKRTLQYNWINPAFSIQNAFNQVAATEINSYHRYLLSVEAQETRRRYLLNAYGISGDRFGLKERELVNTFDFSQPVIGIGAAFLLSLPVWIMAFVFVLIASFRIFSIWGSSNRK